ncbi:phage tail length tape measure family protein [Niveispirillum cyanobacteriorum]|uniref:Uncharacterized protein n=1 Tax=Niveispirillum cyanobacteriorum TaxID=1612173 RepID=A0A2K9NFQ7_9PROT|nr:phage tail length tape measure family protein [Niveispirillum cyanobacteriorum]AUN31938.1 hypothetical protein C0V82_16025 [Niveispirillum cyanobacteriorum]GGE85611.1 hypothetical protein GCM10011317_48510 [Niveispirillum cyanobacteriorum]
MASLQNIAREARIRGAYDSNIAGAAERDAAALRNMAGAADAAAASGEKMAASMRVSDEALRRADPSFDKINRKLDENIRLTQAKQRAEKEYERTAAELRREMEDGNRTEAEGAELIRRAGMVRDQAIARAEKSAEQMRRMFAQNDMAVGQSADSVEAYINLLGRLDPFVGQQQRYNQELDSAEAILRAVNATERERFQVFQSLADMYDPATQAVNRHISALEAEAAAQRKAKEAADAALAQKVIAARQDVAQTRFSSFMGVGGASSGSAAASAEAFAKMFQAQDWQAMLDAEDQAQRERIQQTKRNVALNWQAMLDAERQGAAEAEIQLARNWQAILAVEEMAQAERLALKKAAAPKAYETLVDSFDQEAAAARRYASALTQLRETAALAGISADRLAADEARLAAAMSPAVRSAEQAVQAYRELRASMDPVIASQQRYQAALAAMQAGHRALGISGAQAAAEIAQLQRHMGVTGRGMGLAAHEAGALAQQIQDIGVSVAGGQNPFLVLTQQVPQAAYAVGGFGRLMGLLVSPVALVATTVLAVGAALAIVTMRFADIQGQARRYTAELKALNPELGVTADRLREMEFSIANQRGTSREPVRSTLSAVIANRNIRSPELAQQLAGVSQDMSAVLGQDASAWGKRLADAFGQGAAGVRRLDEELGFLSVAQAASITMMERQGDRAGALSVAIAALEARYGGAGKALKGDFATAVTEVARAWDDLVESLARSQAVRSVVEGLGSALKGVTSLLKEASLESQRDTIEKQIQNFRSGASFLDGMSPGIVARRQESIRALEKKLAEIERRINAAASTNGSANNSPYGSFTDDQAKRLTDARTELDLYKQTLAGVGVQQRIAQAGSSAFNAELRAGGTLASAQQQRLVAEQRAWADLSDSVQEAAEAARNALPGLTLIANAQGGTVQQQDAAARTARLYAEAMDKYGESVAAAVLAGKPLPDDLTKLAAAWHAADIQKRAGEMNAMAAASGRAAEQAAAVGAAYLISAADGVRAAAMQQAANDNVTTGVNAAARARQLLSVQTAEMIARGGEAVAQARIEATAQEGVARAAAGTTEGLMKAQLAGKVAAATQVYRTQLLVAEGKQAESLIKIIDALTEATLRQAAADREASVAIAAKDADRGLGRLRERNTLLGKIAGGGRESLSARFDLEAKVKQWEIDDAVRQLEDSLRDVNGAISDTNKQIVEQTRAEMSLGAERERQIKVMDAADTAAMALGNIGTRIAAGDWSSVAEGVGDFMSKFHDLQKTAGSAAKSFTALGLSLLESAEAGNALGNLVAELFGGRSDAQNRNAQIGSTVATTVGDFFGVPQGLSSFVGNIVGGLFGPGKSDSTAGVDVYTRNDRVVNFDTSANKQDSGNMSARDALAQSVNTFSNLLTELTGGTLAEKIAIEVGSRDGNRWRVYGADGSMAASGTTAVGDIEGTLSQVLSAITNTLTGVDAALKSRLQSVDFSNLQRAEGDVNFILAYDTAIQKLNGTLEGGSDDVETARKNVVDMRNYVRDFADQAGRLGYDAGVTAAALRSYVERFAGIGEAVPEMTEMETQVAALRAAFGELAPVLELVGYSASDAATAVQKAEAAKMAALRADVSSNQDRRYNDLIGNDFINSLQDLIAQRATDVRDARAVGLSDAGAQRNFVAGLSGTLTSSLRADQLQEAIRLFGDIPEVAAAANAALSQLASGIDGTAAAARSAADIANERAGLEVRLLELQGNNAALLERQRDALDASNRSLFDQVQAAQLASNIANERKGLEDQLLQAQGDTVALRLKERAALDESNRSIYDQIKAIEDQKAANEAARQAASVTASLQDRLLTAQQRNNPDAAIQALLRRQQAEFAAGQAAGYSAEQMQLLANVLAQEMTDAVADLNAQTQALSDQLQTRLLRAQAANPLLEEMQRQGLESQATQIERAQELAAASNDNVRAMLRSIYAAEDLAAANQAVADSAADAARQAQDAASALERIRGIGGSIRDWVNQARAGGIESFLSPAEQLANARSQFNSQLGLARGNDQTALGSITAYAQRYADALLANGASGTDTDSAIRQVLAQLETLPAVQSFDAQQTALLTSIRDATIQAGGVIDNTKLTAQAVAGLGSGSGDGTLLAIGKLTYAGNLDRINLLNATNTILANGLSALGSLMLDGNTRLANLHTWWTGVWSVMSSLLDKTKYNTAETAKKLGGGYAYASGTDWHPGGWAMVGEQGPELAFLPQGTAVATAAESRAALSRPRAYTVPQPYVSVPANGNSGDAKVLEEVRKQNALMAEQNRLLAEQNRLLRSQGGTLDDIADTNAQMASDRPRAVVGRRAAAVGG